MLLLMAHCTLLSILPKLIRAVATILEHKKAGCTTDTIITAVMCKLDPILNLMDYAANMAQEAVINTRVAGDRLYRMGETRDNLQRFLEVIKEDIQRTTDGVKDEAAKLTEAAAVVFNNNGAAVAQSSGHQEPVTGCVTYAEALNSCLPSTHLSLQELKLGTCKCLLTET